MEARARIRISGSAGILLVAILVVVGSAAAQTPREILDATGVQGGLVVHVGCGDGTLTAGLRGNDSYLVHGLDADPGNVAAARKHLRSLGLYGPVSVADFDGKRLPYAEGLVNLLVSEDLGAVPMSEAMRVVAPDGVAYVKSAGKWIRTVKRRPAEMDEWTHFRHSAEGNMVSQDRLIGPPRHVQWISGPIFQRHHGIVPSITTIVSGGGRMFYSLDEAPMGLSGMPDQWHIIARDAFNGVLLWKRKMGAWGSRAWSYWTEGHAARFNHPLHVRKRLVASGDRVYATLDFNGPVIALDAATGKTVRTYEGTEYTDEFVLREGVLYLAVNDRVQKPWGGKGVEPAPPANPPPPSQKHIRAVEAATGKLLWKAGPFLGNPMKPDRLGSLRHLNLTVGAKGVFLIEEKDVVALAVADGKELWRTERARLATPSDKPEDVGNLYHKLIMPNAQAVIYHNDMLYILHPAAGRGLKTEGLAILQALNVETGREVWRHATATPIAYLDTPDVFGIDESIWITDKKAMTLIDLDAATGEVRQTHSIAKALKVGHHHRCYPNRASVKYAILGRRGAEFVDLKTGEVILHHWARTACRQGHVLANGLFYRPTDHCRCYMSFQPRGFFAMTPVKSVGSPGISIDETLPFEKGPAFGKPIRNPQSEIRNGDWPTYRHDAMRSSAATTTLPTSPKPAWEAPVGGGLTPPVVAGGKVFCATQDDHQVHAFDAASGEKAWSFTAGGRVDSPPTISNDMAVFGCRDGWVYCLRASDGALVWRLRAAPAERNIVAFGQVESVWPVHGSVLVTGGTAYLVAGRSSLLDMGMYALAVDVASGKILDRKRLHETQTDTKTSGKLPEAGLSDILVSNGSGVYLRSRNLDLSPPLEGVGPADLAAAKPQLIVDGGFFNDRWFHRAFWNFRSSAGKASGNLIAFDATRAFVAAANGPGSNNKSFHIPAGGYRDRITGLDGKGPSWLAHPNLQVGGCLLFAAKTKGDGKSVDRKGKPRTKADPRAPQPPAPSAWRIAKFPLMPWAMVIGGKTLIAAGPMDKFDEKDPWASLSGRAGGSLVVLNADDGKTIAECALSAPPVWNGAAAASGRIYLSLRDGKLVCFEN